jgi:Zn-dependent peptidase ImmA (M78 family)
MARTVDAIIEPSLLVWARQSIGLDMEQAAAKIGVGADRLAAWERGEARPSVAQLRHAASIYKRPLAVFYLPEPPRDFQPPRDYRRLPDAEVGKLSPALHAAIRRSHALREIALDLREIADEPVAGPPQLVDGSRDPERFGEAARELLGVSLSRQYAWDDPGRALNGWIDAFAAVDVLVLQVQSIPLREMRGFSVWADPLPVVTLNGGDFPRGRIFTLLHEFSHVLLHADGVCDLLPRRRARSPADEVEIFCNRAAAAALMPATAFRAEPVISRAPTDGRWDEDAIEALSVRYTVSKEAVVRRLYTLGLTHWGFMQEKQSEYRAAYEAYREEQKRRRQEAESPGGPSYYRMKVRDLGRGLIESALGAYHQRAITGSELSEFLEIKLNQVPKLERELAQTGAARD